MSRYFSTAITYLFLSIVFAECFPLSLSISVAYAADPTGANEEESLRKQLEKMRNSMEREEARITALRKEQTDIQIELEKIDQIQSATVVEKASLSKSIGELEARVDQTTVDLSETQARIDELQAAMGKRIVAIYKTRRRPSALDYLYKSTSATDLLKRAFYLSRIAEFDSKVLNELTNEVKGLNEKQSQLTMLCEEKNKQLGEVSKVEKQLEEQKAKKAVLLRKANDKMKQSEKSLARLKSSAETLEAALAKIMGSEEKVSEQQGRKPEEVKVIGALSRSSVAPATASSFSGNGLEGLKGRLPFPVEGEVVQCFGKQKVDQFTDILFNKGVEVFAPTGSPVKAVSDGKVIFSRALPGYGNVIILDHGFRYYTLYGRLEVLNVQLGEVVKGGGVLASIGEADKRGRNFYFELRIRGKATDPAPFFKAMKIAKSAHQ